MSLVALPVAMRIVLLLKTTNFPVRLSRAVAPTAIPSLVMILVIIVLLKTRTPASYTAFASFHLRSGTPVHDYVRLIQVSILILFESAVDSTTAIILCSLHFTIIFTDLDTYIFEKSPKA